MNCQIDVLANFFNGNQQICNMGNYNARSAACSTGSQTNRKNVACVSGGYVVEHPKRDVCRKRTRVICTECC